MRKVNHQEFRKLIRKAYQIKRPLFGMGGTGIGKSVSMLEEAKQISGKENLTVKEGVPDKDAFSFIDIRAPEFEPVDFRGIPDVDEGKTVWRTPEFWPSTGKGFIVFEELNLAPPAIQAPLYQLILDRQLGKYEVPDGFSIFALGNRLQDMAHVYDMAAPLKNRFLWAELKPPTEDQWINWALDNDIDHRIVSFIKANPIYLYKPPEEREVHVFPTPRAYEYASDAIKGEEDNMIQFFASTAIGEPAAAQLAAFVKLTKQIDFDAILNDPRNAPLPDEVSAKYALTSALSQRLVSKKTKGRLKKILTVATRLSPEYGILMLRMLLQLDEEFFKREVPRTKPGRELANQDYLKFLS